MAIGAFMGVLVVMTNQMLIMFAVFVDYAYNAEDQTEGAVKTYEAMAAFFFLLFADYFLFVLLLGAFKSVIVADGTGAATSGSLTTNALFFADFQGEGVIPGGNRAADDADFDEMPPINI